MQTEPSLASPPNGGTGAPTGPIYAGDTATTPTQATSESTGATDLGSILDAIRKLAPGADQQTNEELTDHLLAMCTSDNKATELATAAQETSRVAETAEDSMLRRNPMFNAQALTVDITSPTAKRFGHSEAASGTPTDTLHAWNRIETFVRGKYDQKDDEVRQESQAQIEKNLQARRESIQRIDAIDYFFLFPGNLDNFRHGPYAIPEEYLAEFELSPEEKQECQALDDYITLVQLNLSREAVSTLHPCRLAPEVFSG